MLEATGRSLVRAAHLHFMVTAPGYPTLVTHIFVVGEPQLDKSADTPAPDGSQLSQPWSKARFDIVLAPANKV